MVLFALHVYIASQCCTQVSTTYNPIWHADSSSTYLHCRLFCFFFRFVHLLPADQGMLEQAVHSTRHHQGGTWRCQPGHKGLPGAVRCGPAPQCDCCTWWPTWLGIQRGVQSCCLAGVCKCHSTCQLPSCLHMPTLLHTSCLHRPTCLCWLLFLLLIVITAVHESQGCRPQWSPDGRQGSHWPAWAVLGSCYTDLNGHWCVCFLHMCIQQSDPSMFFSVCWQCQAGAVTVPQSSLFPALPCQFMPLMLPLLVSFNCCASPCSRQG